MVKKYREVEHLGMNIDTVVRNLVEYREKGEYISTEFNGVMLYSDTVTLDSAYRAITGKSKAEAEKARREWIENLKKEDEEHRANIPRLSVQWIEKGKEILDKEKWELWSEIVPIRLEDLYKGMELDCCLKIVKILQSGTFEEAKAELESQGHSDMSHSLVCAMVKEFSPKGEEFVERVK